MRSGQRKMGRRDRPLPLRSEQPPDDAAVVLRAGVMGADNVRRSAERTFALYAVYGISVEGCWTARCRLRAVGIASLATARCASQSIPSLVQLPAMFSNCGVAAVADGRNHDGLLRLQASGRESRNHLEHLQERSEGFVEG